MPLVRHTDAEEAHYIGDIKHADGNSRGTDEVKIDFNEYGYDNEYTDQDDDFYVNVQHITTLSI